MGLLAAQHLPTTLLGDTNIIRPYCNQPISSVLTVTSQYHPSLL